MLCGLNLVGENKLASPTKPKPKPESVNLTFALGNKVASQFEKLNNRWWLQLTPFA